jgi:hypothetical protein
MVFIGMSSLIMGIYGIGIDELYSTNPLPVDQAYKELLPAVYENYDFSTPHNLHAHHEIGLLFAVFAVAAMLDPTIQPRDDIAAQYHALSRAALVSGRVMEHPTCEAIQCLVRGPQTPSVMMLILRLLQLLHAVYFPLVSPANANDTVEWVSVG